MNTALLIGASRGLGHAIAAELLRKGWDVAGTVRGSARTELHDLADANPGRVEIESLELTSEVETAALAERLAGRRFEMLFVNAGTVNADPSQASADVSTDDFVRVMVTNALGPMRAIGALKELVTPDGLIGVMSSGQGSIANNERAGNDVYRASKAALNQLMRSYAARHAGEARALVLMAPGWIRTALGGLQAPFGLEETVPEIVEALLAQQGRPGLRYIDRKGATVPW